MSLNNLRKWFSRSSAIGQRQRRTGKRRAKSSCELRLERLEDRTLPAVTFYPQLAYAIPTNNTDTALGMSNFGSPIEPTLSIDPNNPANVAISTQGGIRISTDGGAKYSAVVAYVNPAAGRFGNFGDTATAFDAHGQLFWTNLDGVAQTGIAPNITTIPGVAVEKVNLANGNPIGNTVQVDLPVAPANDDRQYMAADSFPNSPYHDNLYVVWTQFAHTYADGKTGSAMLFSRSTNGGANWSTPIELSTSSEGFVQQETIAVAQNGDVYVAYHSQTGFSGGNPDGTSGQVFVSRSTNGGFSFTKTVTQPYGPGQADITFNNQAYFNNAIPPVGVNASRTIPGARFLTQGSATPYVLVDPVRPGRVYVIAADDPSNGGAGQASDVVVATSLDFGATWTRKTLAAGPGNSFNLFPQAGIDKFGDIVVAWYTNGNNKKNASGDFLLDVLATYSTDGGNTWSNGFQVNDAANSLDPFNGAVLFTPNDPASPPTTRIGEYFGLGIHGDTAYVAWNGNTFSGKKVVGQQVFTDTFSIRGSLQYTDNLGVNDNITLRNLAGNPKYFELLQGTTRLYAGQWANMNNITIDTGRGTDTVDIENVASGVSVTVYSGQDNDTVQICRDSGVLRPNILGNVTVYGDNVDVNDRLIINDKFGVDNGSTFTVTPNTVQESAKVKGAVVASGRITYLGVFRGGVTVNGSPGGNTFNVNGTHAFATTLNTGSNANTVFVNATSGPLTVNGQGGADNVNIGANGLVQDIHGVVTVTNSSGSSGFSAVTVDDSADKTARAVILYNDGSNNVISGLGNPDIVLRGGNLRSLAINAGSRVVNGVVVGGNTFRIHDTPTSTVRGGVTTTVNTGAGPDNVTIDGTTGALDLNVQGAATGANFISVGSATASLDRINGPINITGNVAAFNSLSIIDSVSNAPHDYVIDRNFVQRLDKARIGYKNMSELKLQTGAQPAHITVQNTKVFGTGQSTSIVAGGSDAIDVLRTTGTLLIGAGGSSAINVGDSLNSLDNMQGVIGVTPSAGSMVTLSLNDEAATTTQQLDVGTNFFGFAAVQRSGAAVINVLSSSLYKFNWQSGSGGTILHEYIKPAQLTNYILGNDVLTIGTRAGTASDFGPITVTGGVGPDAVILNDSGETRSQTYDISQVAGHEILAMRGTTVDLGPDIETFEVQGGAGGNVFNVSGTIAGMNTILHLGAGVNTVTIGGSADLLQAIQGPLTIDGAGGTNSLIFDDQGTTTPEYYYLAADLLRRQDGLVDDMAPISLAGFAAVTLNLGSGSGGAQVLGSAAGSAVTVNSQVGSAQNVFVIDASTNAILGPVYFNGHTANFDYAEYFDLGDTAPHTYTLNSTGVTRDDQAPVFLSGVFGTLLFTSTAGGNTVNVNSVAFGSSYAIIAEDGDHVTVGSLAPGLGGTLADILDQVNVISAANAAVTLVFDDSGNTDTTPKHITFSGFDADGNVNMQGLTSIGMSWNLSPASSVTVLGGAADETFSILPIVTTTPLRIDGGGGVNTLDYSGYAGATPDSLPGLVSWYKGEGDFTDSTSGNDGTPMNGVTFAPGKVGHAFSFDGIDDFVEIPDSPNQTPDSISIQAWVNPNDVSGLRSIMSKYESSDPGPDNVSWFLGSINGHIEFGVYQSGNGRVIETDDAVLTAGDWQHVAGTFDVATQDIKIYLNGVEIASSFVPGHDFTVTGIGDSTSPVRIGSLSDSNGDLNGFWDGLIDEPAFYNRALSAGEVQSLASASGVGNSISVVVNLPLGTATGLAGGIANIQNVIGSAGNDILVGNGGNVLTGGAGRDLLIAGAFASTLNGGDEEDILIAGTTNYDQNPAALMAVMTEWTRNDGINDDYASRIANLQSGANGAPILNADTVHSNGGGNTLNGNAGRDLFFANLALDTLDGDPLTEVLVAV